MSLATFLIVFAVIVAGGLLGLFLLAGWLIKDVRDLVEAYRGIATDVRCPRNGHPATIRVGRRAGEHGLHVLWCEQFPEGAPRCAAECFGAFTGAAPRVA